MIDDSRLQEITDRIIDIVPARSIMVFGSYARGDVHQHSDLNLCVLVAPDAERRFEEWPSKSWLYRSAELIQGIPSAEAAIAACVFTEGEFDALRRREHPLVGQILEEGRVVYEQ